MPEAEAPKVVLSLAIYLLALPFTVLPHEMGHAVVARLLGVGVRSVHVGHGIPRFEARVAGIETQFHAIPSGGHTFMDAQYAMSSAWRRAAILAAGPLVNIALASACWAAVSWRPFPGGFHDIRPLLPVAAANAWVALTNLLPSMEVTTLGSWPSDGLGLMRLISPDAADRLARKRPARPRAPGTAGRRAMRLLLVVTLGVVALCCLGLAMLLWTAVPPEGSRAPHWLAMMFGAVAAFVTWSAVRAARGPVRDERPGNDDTIADRATALGNRAAAELRLLPCWPDGTPADDLPGGIARAMREGGTESWAALLRAVLAEAPGHVPARLSLAEALVTLGQEAEARALYETLVEDVPRGGAILSAVSTELAILQLRAGLVVEAASTVERFIEAPWAAADKVLVLDGAACVALYEGRTDLLGKSLDWIDRALDLEPQNLTLLGTRGALLVEQGRAAEGEPLLARVQAGSAAAADQGISAAYLAIGAWQRGEPRAAARLARTVRLRHPAPWLHERLARAEREARPGG